MKRYISSLLLLAILTGISFSQLYYPYTLGAISDKDIPQTASLVWDNLAANGFEVLGEYSPAEDFERYVMAITSEELLSAVGKTGGLTGFAAALRVGLTIEDGKVHISYTSPEYWLNAYYREDYEKVKSILDPVSEKLVKVMKASGTYKGTPFGSEKGLEADDLHKYHYMAAMPKFDKTNELGEFASYQEAIDKIESGIIKGIPNIEKIYSVEIPGKELKLYGFGLGGENGETNFLPIIDISSPKHTAFLPYEILVMGNEVHMLHGRYRIALSFPDLTMGTFTKIMSSPGDIEDLLESIVE